MQEQGSTAVENRDTQLDMESILRDVLRQWWVILMMALAAALFYGAYLKAAYVPEYTARTTFVVGKSGFTNYLASDNLSAAQSMTEQLTQITESSLLKKQVCKDLGLSSFEGTVSVSVVESSNLMTLTVRAQNPRLTWRMIHSVMDTMAELGGELMENISVRVLQEPTVPSAPSNPLNVRRDMMKAGLAAACGMCLLFALLSYRKDTIKNEDEVKRKVDAHLLGTIYHERKYKTLRAYRSRKQYSLTIDNPGLSFGYVESVRMIATRVMLEMEKRKYKTILVSSVSENEGKSTVAANLALSMAQEGKNVVLLDCDFRKPSQYKIFELSENSQRGADLGTALQTGVPVKLLQAEKEKNLKIAFSVKVHRRMMNQDVTGYLKEVLGKMAEKVDCVILDSSPMALVAEGEVLAGLVDASLLVVQQDLMEARYINDTVDLLNRAGGRVIGCVYNNVHPGFLGKSRAYGYCYGKYRYGYGYSRYGYYGRSRKNGGEPEEQEE